MTQIFNTPATIECNIALLKTRKLIITRPIIHNILKVLVYRCKMEMNSSALIEKELFPKEAKINKGSFLDKGVQIIGDSISVISKKPIKKDKVVIKKRIFNT
jgi:hypothetical protein